MLIIQLGTVPHVFAVIKPTTNNTYNMGFFFRDNIYPYDPSSPPTHFEFNGDQYLKDYLFTKLHNGLGVVRNVPPMNKLYIRPKENTIQEIGRKWHKDNADNIEPTTTVVTNSPFTKLMVSLVSGADLVAKDSNGLSDPFVVIQYGEQKLKSSTVPKTLNPVWNEEFELDITNGDPNLEISFTVFDKDPVKADYMGEFSLLLKDALDLHGETQTFMLTTYKTKSRVSGHLSVRFVVL